MKEKTVKQALAQKHENSSPSLQSSFRCQIHAFLPMHKDWHDTLGLKMAIKLYFAEN